MTNQERLREYYINNCSHLIFVNETSLDEAVFAKVYLYNFTTDQELTNYKKVFQEYLVYYVRNYDMFERIVLPTEKEDVSKYLTIKSKQVRFNNSLPQRPININGLYGELFNDYYLRNVCNNQRLCAYISKRTFGSGNNENKGFDNVFCDIVDDSLEVILSDAKFIVNLSATNALVEDTGHVNLDYINDYMNIVLQKQEDVIRERNKVINKLIADLNNLIEDEDKNFVEALNALNGSVKFVYFAIFKNIGRDIIRYENKINKIVNEFNSKILSTGIKKYSIEVVFIPTFNESMSLKREMENWQWKEVKYFVKLTIMHLITM